MSVLIRLLVILAAMIAFLSTMVVTHAHHRANGREVILAMEPLDPRDLLLGYYSIIRTQAHTLDLAELDGPKTGWEIGDRVFVTLEDLDDGASYPVAVSAEQPTGGVFLQGRVRSVSTMTDWEDIEDPAPDDEGRSPRRQAVPGSERDQLRVVYNLEAYYAEAEQARALDTMRNEDRLRLIVSLAPDGRAVIKGLEIDGERRIDRILPGPG